MHKLASNAILGLSFNYRCNKEH